MKKIDLIKDLKDKKGILSKHGTWGLYLLKDDRSIGHCYCGRINPKTAEELIKQNPEWKAPDGHHGHSQHLTATTATPST